MNENVNIDAITFKEKCFILLLFTETNSKKQTYHLARIVFPHLTKYRIRALLLYYQQNPLEFYVSCEDIMTRMF